MYPRPLNHNWCILKGINIDNHIRPLIKTADVKITTSISIIGSAIQIQKILSIRMPFKSLIAVNLVTAASIANSRFKQQSIASSASK